VDYMEQRHWCTVYYYEMNQRVGEPYQASQSRLIVDGYCHPSSADRFCLGTLSNVNRTEKTVEVRRSIGRGAEFNYFNGEIFVQNLSDHNSIFVQSPLMNISMQMEPKKVCKVPPGCQLKLFNNVDFAKRLTASVVLGFEAVFALTRFCSIRVSFVKGWGGDYQRPEITSCPCWIELHLNGPLTWLDHVLLQMRPIVGIESGSR